MWNYSERMKDHFFNPRNVGEVVNPNAVGEVGSLACGDALRLTLDIDEESGRIRDAKFQTFGCGSAIASSSALTEMIKGMTVEEALKITNEDIAKYLDGLPKEKMHCSVMGRDALDAAIANFRGEEVKRDEDDGRLVCTCYAVSEEKIRRVALENHLTTLDEITNYTKAGGGCQTCHPLIDDILDDLWGTDRKGGGEMTLVGKIRRIEEVLERDIRPLLQKDGGDVRLMDVQEDRVIISLLGACGNCPASQRTRKSLIEARLREAVSPDIVVEEAARPQAQA